MSMNPNRASDQRFRNDPHQWSGDSKGNVGTINNSKGVKGKVRDVSNVMSDI